MSNAIQRALAAKSGVRRGPRPTGLKLVGLGIHLTLLGRFVPELGVLVFVGVAVSLYGLVIE